MKKCIGCMKDQQENAFYNSTTTEDGLNPYCKGCCKVNRSLESVRRRDRKSKISFRQRHRVKTLGLACDSTITLAKLFKRDRGICQLCHKWVKPKAASIDHKEPVSRGGTHTWDNVQLVHLVCNLRKGDRV